MTTKQMSRINYLLHLSAFSAVVVLYADQIKALL